MILHFISCFDSEKKKKKVRAIDALFQMAQKESDNNEKNSYIEYYFESSLNK